jgi:FAD/FMN-containing dehydrogenase
VSGADGLAESLAEIVGERYVIADADLMASYEIDATGRYSGSARLVVSPADGAECAGVLVACAAAGVPVVPQGGNTGLVGAGIPRQGEVVLSTRRLSALEEIDEVAGQMTVGAGMVLGDAQAAATRAGRELTLDHGARSAATLGGMAATDAGGAMALRYGTTRSHVVGLEAVLADGRTVSRMSGLIKDNAGYRWPDLLVGSEGTLAVITRLRLKLAEPPPQRISALFGATSIEHAMALLGSLREHVPSLRAADFFTAEGLELVCRHRDLRPPLAAERPIYLIVECAGRGDLLEELAAVDPDGREEIAVADDTLGQTRLWEYRDAHNEAIRANGVPHKLDVSVPLAAIAGFVADLRALLAADWPEALLVLYGHLGDGNLHVNILGLDPEDGAVDEAVLRLATGRGGTISAEHGVGIAKVKWLGLVRSEEEIALMRSLKTAFDPAGVLSPGRVLA